MTVDLYKTQSGPALATNIVTMREGAVLVLALFHPLPPRRTLHRRDAGTTEQGDARTRTNNYSQPIPGSGREVSFSRFVSQTECSLGLYRADVNVKVVSPMFISFAHLSLCLGQHIMCSSGLP
jgi:hypothetical protein